MQRASTLLNKGEKDMKPIIIDDTPITDDMLGVNDQQKCTKAKLLSNLTIPGINQTYSQLVMRLPPRPPDPHGTKTPKITTRIKPNVDLKKTHPTKRE